MLDGYFGKERDLHVALKCEHDNLRYTKQRIPRWTAWEKRICSAPLQIRQNSARATCRHLAIHIDPTFKSQQILLTGDICIIHNVCCLNISRHSEGDIWTSVRTNVEIDKLIFGAFVGELGRRTNVKHEWKSELVIWES